MDPAARGWSTLVMDATAVLRPSLAVRERWFLAALILLFVSLSVQYSLKVVSHQRETRSAFLRWREQILKMEQGANPWDENSYPNPPIMALLLRPLMELPP